MTEYSVGQPVTVQRPGRDARRGTVAHIHTAQGYVAVADDQYRDVTTYPARFVTAIVDAPAKKVYKRTEGDTVTYISQREGQAELSEAQMSCEGVREISQINRTDFAIDYLRVGEVRLELVDESAGEPSEWHGTHNRPFHLHRFDETNRARCNRSIRANAKPPIGGKGEWGVFKKTRSEIEGDEYADLFTFCPKCAAK